MAGRGPSPRDVLGQQAEESAARYLRELGFRILARRHRCRWGEIDLIAEEGDCLCFVEVRSRRPGPVRPFETVGLKKQRRIAAAAIDYLVSAGIATIGERAIRFDVVEVNVSQEGAFTAELCRDAFEAPE